MASRQAEVTAAGQGAAWIDRARRLMASTVARNALALYGAQAATFLLPLVTVPFLARVLRPEGWGMVVFCQAFGSWLALVLQYGFGLSATRAIAQSRDDPAKVAAIVAEVQGAKLLLSVALAAVGTCALLAVPAFRAHPGYLAWSWVSAVATGLVPLWFFQGIERLRGPALLDVATRVAATAGVLLFVDAGRGWLVLALNAGASLLSAGVSLAWMYRIVPVRRCTLEQALGALRSGWSLFVFCSAASVYTTANAFLLGLIAAPAAVSYYGPADKVVRAAIATIGPLSQAMFPHINHLVSRDPARATHVARRTIVPIGGYGLLSGAVIAVAAPWIVRALLGPAYEPVVPVMRILSVLPGMVAVGTVIGVHWAIPLGLDRMYVRFVVAAGVVNLLLAALLVPRYGAVGMAWTAVLAEAVVEGGLVWLIWRHTRAGYEAGVVLGAGGRA